MTELPANSFWTVSLSRIKKYVLPLLAILFISVSCTGPRHIGRTSIPGRFLSDPAISGSHAGIALYETESRSYLYRYNSGKYFVPASNMKIFTLYAGLKYLGDSIPGIEYAVQNDTVFLRATGDPSFLLDDFPVQPVFDFLKYGDTPMVFIEPEWETDALGFGWPWDNYLEYYMPERSPFPVYGNGILWSQKEPYIVMTDPEGSTGMHSDSLMEPADLRAEPAKLPEGQIETSALPEEAGALLPDKDSGPLSVFNTPVIRWPVEIYPGIYEKFEVKRPFTENMYKVFPGAGEGRDLFVPFATGVMNTSLELLEDTLKKEIGLIPGRPGQPEVFHTLYSRPSDSLFRPMMLHSINLFAEQALIMTSRKLFGVMDEKWLITFMLENDLAGLPQRPRWVDGSGLSRYNMATPESFVLMLDKMNDEFGFDRISNLLPTGGEGTLENLYVDGHGRVFAKTGTLGNAIALSGFIITRRERLLIFSILINNHQKESREVREAVERFLKEIIYRY